MSHDLIARLGGAIGKGKGMKGEGGGSIWVKGLEHTGLWGQIGSARVGAGSSQV